MPTLGIASLNDRHRVAAQLRAQGLTWRAIAAETGYAQDYITMAAARSPAFQAYQARCREELEASYLTSARRLYDELTTQQLQQLIKRRQRTQVKSK